MKLPKLDKCPFCGSKAGFFELEFVMAVECQSDKCTARVTGVDEKDAAKAWNRRKARKISISTLEAILDDYDGDACNYIEI